MVNLKGKELNNLHSKTWKAYRVVLISVFSVSPIKFFLNIKSYYTKLAKRTNVLQVYNMSIFKFKQKMLDQHLFTLYWCFSE